MGLSQLICYPQVAHRIDELLPFILNYLSPFGGDSRHSKRNIHTAVFLTALALGLWPEAAKS
jgi:hypothetical protein